MQGDNRLAGASRTGHPGRAMKARSTSCCCSGCRKTIHFSHGKSRARCSSSTLFITRKRRWASGCSNGLMTGEDGRLIRGFPPVASSSNASAAFHRAAKSESPVGIPLISLEKVVPCVSGARLNDKAMFGTFMTADRIAEVMKRALDRERPPARLNGEQTADLLGFEKYDLAFWFSRAVLRGLLGPVWERGW